MLACVPIFGPFCDPQCLIERGRGDQVERLTGIYSNPARMALLTAADLVWTWSFS